VRASTTPVTSRPAPRAAIWLADFALRFRDETVMSSPPPAVQRLLVRLVARLAR
jgi:hypothetical protein